MKLNDKVYTVLKYLVMIVLPATVTLVTTIGNLVGWQYTAIAVGIIGAVTAFLGSMIGVSTKNYNTSESLKDMDESALQSITVSPESPSVASETVETTGKE